MRGDPFHTVNGDTEKQISKKETEMTKKVVSVSFFYPSNEKGG